MLPAGYTPLPVAEDALEIPFRPPTIRTSIPPASTTADVESAAPRLPPPPLPDVPSPPPSASEPDLEPAHFGCRTFLGRSCCAVLVTASVLLCTAVLAYAIHYIPERPEGTEFAMFAVGDWGKTGNKRQLAVAAFMGALGSYLHPNIVLSTGDNLYPSGMSSASDPAFAATFSDIYTAASLQVPWHAVLGNHDYGQGSQDLPVTASCPEANTLAECIPGCCFTAAWQAAQFNSSLDPRWHCSQGVRQLLLLGGALQVVLLDTSPFVPSYRSQPWASVPGGVQEQDAAAIKVDVLRLLAAPGPTWRIVVGHHSIRSYGRKCAVKRECEHFEWLAAAMHSAGVHLYLNGHDHMLQHVKRPDEATHYVTSGGGAKVRPGDADSWAPVRPYARYLAYAHGFAAVFVQKERLVVRLYGLRRGLRPLYEFAIEQQPVPQARAGIAAAAGEPAPPRRAVRGRSSA